MEGPSERSTAEKSLVGPDLLPSNSQTIQVHSIYHSFSTIVARNTSYSDAGGTPWPRRTRSAYSVQ